MVKTSFSTSKKAFLFLFLLQFHFAQDTFSQALNLQITAIQHISCNGGSDGSTTAQASGGVPPYSYAWSNGGSGPMINNLSAGTYTCTVTDLQMATASKQAVVTQPSQLQLELVSQQNIDCNKPLGAATVDGSGGIMPYQYNWSNGSNGPTVNNLTAGTHTVTLVDANQCTVAFSINILSDTNPPDIIFSGAPLPLTCDRITTVINASMSSNGPQYSVTWTGEGIINNISPLIISVNEAGPYVLEIVDNSSGCVARDTMIVNQLIMPPMVIIDPPNEITCAEPIIQIDAAQSSMGPPFSYLWSTNNGNIVSGQGTLNLEANKAGLYTLQITNSNNGCTAENSVVVSQNLQSPEIVIIAEGFSFAPDSTFQIDCNNPQGKYTSYNDNVDWTHTWSEFVGGISTPLSNDTCIIVDQAGEYILMVLDTTNGCSVSDTILIVEDLEPPLAEITIEGNDVITCENQVVTLIGGAGGMPSVFWEDTVLIASNELTIHVDHAGTYILSVTDTINGCMAADTAIIEDIRDPFPYTITQLDPGDCEFICPILVSYDSSYTGAAWALEIKGNTPSNDTSFTVQGPHSYEFMAPIGFYGISALNANCCAHHDWIIVNPADCNITGTVTTTDVSCLGADDGSLALEFSGASGPVNLLLKFGSEVPVDAAMGNAFLTINEYQSGAVIGGLPASNLAVYGGGGMGVVHIQDEDGCSFATNFTIGGVPTLGITAPDKCNLLACNEDQTGFILTDGCFFETTWDIQWSTGDTSCSVTGLTVGQYWVAAVDVATNGMCTDTFFFEVAVPQPILATFTTNYDPNGVLLLTPTVSGGAAPYQYIWRDENGNIVGQSATLEGHSCGQFLLEITDANGCMETFEVFLVNGEIITLQLESPTCFGGADGSASYLESTQGPVITSLWSTGETTPAIHNLSAGLYSVKISDTTGCEVLIPFTIPENEYTNFVEIYSDGSSIIIHHDTTGSMMPFFNVAISIQGLQTSYDTSFFNTPSNLTIMVSDVPNGSYFVTITDLDTGCSFDQVVSVNDPGCNLSGTFTSTPVSCLGKQDGTISINDIILSGQLPLTVRVYNSMAELVFIDNNFMEGQLNETFMPGNYFVVLTSSTGCSISGDLDVDGTGTFGIVGIIACNGDSTGSALVLIHPGNFPFSIAGYLWSTGDTTRGIQGQPAGNYSVVVTDNMGCTDESFVTIPQPLHITATFTTDTDPQGVFLLIPTVSGGVVPYQYIWRDEAGNILGQSATLEGHPCGQFLLEITDANGCMESFEVFLLDGDIVSLLVLPPTCAGGTDGSAEMTSNFGEILWSTGETTPAIHNLSAGQYSFTVTDAAGDCEIMVPFTIPENAYPNFVDIYSDGSSIIIHHDTTGSMAPFFNVGISIESLPPNDTAFVNPPDNHTITVEDMPNGVYVVFITDFDSGCVMHETVVVNSPDCNINMTATSSAISCLGANNGSITATIVAPAGTLGLNIEVFSVAGPDIVPGPAGESLMIDDTTIMSVHMGLSPGSYFISVFDDSTGCYGVLKVMIDGPSITATTGWLGCAGDTSGVASILVDNLGPSFLSYLWSNGETTRNIQNQLPGDYSVVVTDEQGCAETLNITIAATTDPITITETTTYDANEDIYEISLQVTGGTGPYEFAWANETGNLPNEILDHIRVPPGCYWATITDANDCEGTIIIKIMPSGTIDILSENPITIYPNPSTGTFIIKSDIADQFRRIEIFDMVGKAILAYSDIMPGSIDLSFFESGIYYLKITMEGGEIIMRPLVKI